jgi:hypothetical protein
MLLHVEKLGDYACNLSLELLKVKISNCLVDDTVIP